MATCSSYKHEQSVVLGYSKQEIAWLIGVEMDGIITSAGMLKYGITPSVRKEVFPILKKTTIRETKDFAYANSQSQRIIRYMLRNNGIARLCIQIWISKASG